MKHRIYKQRQSRPNRAATNQIFLQPSHTVMQDADWDVDTDYDDQEHEEQFEDVQALIDHIILNMPQHPLPYRPLLETLLGRSLPDDIRVIYADDIRTLLGDHEPPLEGLAQDRLIILADQDPSFTTLIHEVIHVLQVDPSRSDVPDILPMDDAAESEVQWLLDLMLSRLVSDIWDNFLPLPIENTIAPERIAANRADEAPEPLNDANAPQRDLQQAIAGPDQQAESGSEAQIESTSDRQTDQTTASQAGTVDSEALAEETLDLPEMPPVPEPGVTEEDVAAREEQLAEAQEALDAAEDPKGVIDNFASAPPTLKAQEANSIDGRVSDKASEEESTYQENLPDFHAEMNLEEDEVEVNEVTSPDQSSVAVEEEDPGATPDIELPETPDNGEYDANDDIVATVERWLNSWFGDNRAERIGENIDDVSTTDPETSADPGDPPTVPLEGETDTERMAQRRDATSDEGRRQRDVAQQAVIDGPGPEQAQPRNMDEVIQISTENLQTPTVEASVEAQGADTYLQYEMPEEVDTAFDQDNQAAMEASFEESKAQIAEATTTRDEERQAAVDEAETESQRLSEEADQQQRDHVVNARKDIQSQRQDTLEQQRDAVDDMESNIEARREEEQSNIDNRIEEDEAEVNRKYDDAESRAQDKIDEGEQDAEAEKRQAERDAEDESWWDRAVNFVKEAFNKLTQAINAIFDAVRAAVNSILDAVKTIATTLIEAAAEFVKGAITAFGEFAKAAIDATIGQVYPELAETLNRGIDAAVEVAHRAVDAVAEQLIAGVNALVEGLRGALNSILDAFQAALNTVIAIVGAALSGDWGEVIRLAFEAVLKVAGINPEDIYQFIGRVQETIGLILDDPLGFVGNVIDAVVGGVRQFGDNILQHLQAGIIGWLTGALGSAGITLPEEFDLMGVLDLIRQILGFTWENIRERAVRLVGETAVSVLEQIYGYIETLVSEGWGALFDQIMQDLASLRDMVFDQIKEFVLTRLIMAAVTRLATMFNPVGAIVNLIITAYQFFTFLVDNIQRLVQLITTIADAIGNIARAILEPAKNKVEETLAQFLPMAIDLVARLIGLGNVGGRVRRILTRVQDRIWSAIDSLIERLLRRFRGSTGSSAETDDSTTDGDLGERLPIRTPDGTHHLSIRTQGDNVDFMVESTPKTIEDLVTMWDGRLESITDNTQKTEAETHLNTLSDRDDTAETTLEQLLRRDDTISEEDQDTALERERQLIPILRSLFGIFGVEGADLGTRQQVNTLFAQDIENANQYARENLTNVLVRHASQVIADGHKVETWKDQIRTSQFIDRPLASTTGLGEATQSQVVGWMPRYFTQLENENTSDTPIRRPERFETLHTNRVGQIHGESGTFGNVVNLIRRQIYDRSLNYTHDESSTFYDRYKESIREYVQSGGSTPTHREYQPIILSGFNFTGGSTFNYTYASTYINREDGSIESVDPPVFSVTLTSDQVTSIQGSNLRFKTVLEHIEGRGAMQSPPSYDSNLLLNRSHLIADEFMGSALNASDNIVVTSETYNQRDMRNAERRIAAEITRQANRQANQEDSSITEALPEDIKFDMAISVSYAQSVFDERISEEMEERFERLLRQNQAVISDMEALRSQWRRLNLTLAMKLNPVRPVLRMTYRVTPYYKERRLTVFDDELGADIYLGLNISAVRAVFEAAGGD